MLLQERMRTHIITSDGQRMVKLIEWFYLWFVFGHTMCYPGTSLRKHGLMILWHESDKNGMVFKLVQCLNHGLFLGMHCVFRG